MFQDQPGEAEITAVDTDRVFIESLFFTGWMLKAEFWEAWGIEQEGGEE